MTLKSVCVYLGSNTGQAEDYTLAAQALARELTRRDLTLVYGGARVGLMGVLGDAMIAAGGRTVGIIPQALLDAEIGHTGLDELLVVQSMHERKTLMADRSDAFIAMPGGIGTLEEIFEVWTWAQLGDHDKPVGFLNTLGFYDRLGEFLDYQSAQGFVRAEMRAMALFDDDPVRLLDRFERHEPPPVSKWIREGER